MNEISRINGINSDYKMGNSGAIEEVEGDPLFMRLFICPNRQPNKLKQKTGVCEGIGTSCPANPKTGHAMVELNESDGVILRTDGNNNLVVGQDGHIELNAKNHVKIKSTFTIKISGNQASLESNGGAKIILKSNGNIEIATKNNTGEVLIKGNLKYTGTLTPPP